MMKSKEGTPTEKELVALVEERFHRARQERLPYEQQWHLNLAFLEGHHYAFWNRATQRLEELRPVPHRVRHVSNIILPYWNREVARLGRNDPIFNVVQNTNDDEDVSAARVAEMVLQYLWRSLDMGRKYLEAREWLAGVGTVFFQVGWDPRAGERIRKPRMETVSIPVLDEQGNRTGEELVESPILDETGLPTVDEFNLGEVNCQVLSPFEVFPASARCVDLEGQPWIINARVRTLEDIRTDYPAAGEKVGAEDVTPGPATGHPGYLLGRERLSGATTNDAAQYAVVKEMRERPSARYPGGRLITAANGVLLRNASLPFGRYDLVRIRRIRLPGRFWGESPIVSAIPLQKEWNKILSQVIEHRETMKKGKILIPTTAEVRKSAFTSEHAEIIQYNPMGGPPFQMQLHPLPSDVWKELENIRETMMDIWSQHEVSQAFAPVGVRSGIAIEQLIEQDETTLGAIFTDITHALSQVGKRMLEIVEQHYTETRTLKVAGNERRPDVRDFIGADLRGNHDVFVNIGSALPQLKVTRHQEIKDRYRLGLYGPPSEPDVRKKVLKMLEDTIVEDIYSDDRLDESNAQRENKAMVEGRLVRVRPFDNHEVHLRLHNHHRKLYEVEQIAARHPEVELLLERHVQEHLEYMARSGKAFASPQPDYAGNAGVAGV